MIRRLFLFLSFFITCSNIQPAIAVVLQVGPSRSYTSPCAAFAAASSGDTIEIDGADGSGNQISYVDDVCEFYLTNLTIRGVGSKRPHIRRIYAKLKYDNGMWYHVLSYPTVSTITISHIQFSGAYNGNNAQPLWLGYTSFVIDDCVFTQNENGFLYGNEGAHTTTPVTGPNRIYTGIISNSEFSYNGASTPTGNGGGTSHNIYVGRILRLTITGCYIHDSRGGQGIKSRAQETHVLYNRIVDAPAGVLVPEATDMAWLSDTGGTNYEMDFSLGGLVYVIGNEVYQSSGSSNQIVISYLAEQEWDDLRNTVFKLNISNNTFVNAHGGASVHAVHIQRTPANSQGAPETSTATTIVNNIFAGFASPQVILYDVPTLTGSTPANNSVFTTIGAAGFLNATSQNYHLASGSSAIDAGGFDGGSIDGFSLAPVSEYTHALAIANRTNSGTRDAGAHEYGGPTGSTFTASILYATESSSGVTLLWTPAVSDTDVTGYQVFRNDTSLTTVSALTYSYTSGTAGATDSFYVIALRSGGAAQSNTIQAGKVRQASGGTVGASAGWYELPSTALDNTCLPSSNCWAQYWRNTTAVDTANNRILMMNTGTSGEYAGNNIYALNTSDLTLTRLNSADSVVANGSNTVSGRPNYRHRGMLGWLGGSINQLFLQGGFIPGGTWTNTAWRWTESGNSWASITPTGTPAVYAGTVMWDNTNSRAVIAGWDCLEYYNPTTHAYTKPGGTCVHPYSGFVSAVRDPGRGRVYLFGPGSAVYYNEASAESLTNVTSQTCGRLTSSLPGLAWDQAGDRIVSWSGGNIVHFLYPATNTCTSQAFGGGPGYPFLYETGGKFQVVNGILYAATTTSENWFALRLSSVGGSVETQFSKGGRFTGGGRRR